MSQVIQKRNFRYHYGDSFGIFEVFWKDASGAAINLSGYSAQLAIKAKAGGGTGEPVVLKLTSSASDGLVIDNALGKVSIDATPSKMITTPSALAQGQGYFYDLQVKNSAETQTLLEGEFWVDPEVTTD